MWNLEFPLASMMHLAKKNMVEVSARVYYLLKRLTYLPGPIYDLSLVVTRGDSIILGLREGSL